MGTCSSKSKMTHEQQIRQQEVKKKRQNIMTSLRQGNQVPKLVLARLLYFYIYFTSPLSIKIDKTRMQADSDDLATDFGHEQIKVTPKDQKASNILSNDDSDQTKFQKTLNAQCEKGELQKINSSEAQQSQKEPHASKINELMVNDKNVLIQSNNQPDADYQEPQQYERVLIKPEQIEQIQNQIIKELQTKFQKLQMNQNHSAQNHQNSKPENLQHDNLQVALINQEPYPIKEYTSEPQYISRFSTSFKSSTITLNQALDQAEQSKYYFQNLKIALTEPITSINSQIVFRLDNIKYCVGFGVAVQQILQKHDYGYKSTTSSQMGHGLYIVTSQGYSWSNSEPNDDDAFRQGFNKLYSGVNIKVRLQGENLQFKWKRGQFSMEIPSRIRQKYTLCFCAYLHEKTDAISIVPQ